MVLIHVLLNPWRCKFYVSTHTLTQKGQEKPLRSDSKQKTKSLLLQMQRILIFLPINIYTRIHIYT